jgi:hypothetical protein
VPVAVAGFGDSAVGEDGAAAAEPAADKPPLGRGSSADGIGGPLIPPRESGAGVAETPAGERRTADGSINGRALRAPPPVVEGGDDVPWAARRAGPTSRAEEAAARGWDGDATDFLPPDGAPPPPPDWGGGAAACREVLGDAARGPAPAAPPPAPPPVLEPPAHPTMQAWIVCSACSWMSCCIPGAS